VFSDIHLSLGKTENLFMISFMRSAQTRLCWWCYSRSTWWPKNRL